MIGFGMTLHKSFWRFLQKKAFNTKQYNAHFIDKTNLHIIHGRRYFIDRQYSLFLGQNICVIVYFHIHIYGIYYAEVLNNVKRFGV